MRRNGVAFASCQLFAGIFGRLVRIRFMIRVKCPKCEKTLSIDDSKAGGVGSCPGCGQKFRIPGVKAEKSAAPRPSQTKAAVRRDRPAPSKVANPKSPKPAASPPKEAWEEEDSSPYTMEKPIEQPVSLIKQRLDEEDEGYDDLDDMGLDPEYVRRRKAKKRKHDDAVLFLGASHFATLIIGLFIVWIVLGTVTFFVPLVAVGFYIVGSMVGLAAFIWFLVVAFQDDGALPGLLCIFLPFYWLYYLITHWEREHKPFFLNLMAVLFQVTGIVAFMFYVAKNLPAAPQ